MLKFTAVLSITALAAGSALAGDGYGGHECGSYKSPQASVPAAAIAQTQPVPATVETVEAPIAIDTTDSFETVQVIVTDTVVTPAE